MNKDTEDQITLRIMQINNHWEYARNRGPGHVTYQLALKNLYNELTRTGLVIKALIHNRV